MTPKLAAIQNGHHQKITLGEMREIECRRGAGGAVTPSGLVPLGGLRMPGLNELTCGDRVTDIRTKFTMLRSTWGRSAPGSASRAIQG